MQKVFRLETLLESEQSISINLQFFANDGDDKTEEATPKKLDKAREEGQVAKSTDLVAGVSLMALFVVLKVFAGYMGSKFMEIFTETYSYIEKAKEFNLTMSVAMLRRGMLMILLVAFPFFIAAIFTGFTLNAMQAKWKVTAKPLMPKPEKIDPVKGMKRLFSKDKIFELLKSLIKVFVVAYMVYSTLADDQNIILSLYQYTLIDDIKIIGDVVLGMGIKISAVFIVVGVADFAYQKRKFKKDMRMSKKEVKEEYKESEGDPQIKGKRRQRMQEASMRRMMQDVPTADVVITNPTHFAVALKYDKLKAGAPIVVAKGEDYLAQKIKEKAKECNVEIYEDRPLARMLYFNVEIGDEIPPELYEAVAEVLSYVYKLKNEQI